MNPLRRRPRRWRVIPLALACLAAACAAPPAADTGVRAECATAEPLGRFDPAVDLFIANFDAKSDVDDLHAAAAVATVLRDERFACVDHIATAGAYGEQGGVFIDAPRLFDLAFDDRWVDAHRSRRRAVAVLTVRAAAALARGGDVWIMEGGQSNVSAAVVRSLRAADPARDTESRVHIVQHGAWNEQVTAPADLAYVQTHADYIKIADGNGPGNGSPGYNTSDGSAWPRLLAHPQTGPAWAEARRLADARNGDGWENRTIRAGGLDFSDVVEAAYIFGFEHLEDVDAFTDAFAG